MLIVCPNCKKRFDIDPGNLPGEAPKVRCSSCRAIFRLVRKAPAQVPPAPQEQAREARPQPQPPVQQPPAAQVQQNAQQPAVEPATPPVQQPGNEAPAPTGGMAAQGRIKVIVANESAAFCEAVKKVLVTEPFEVVVCNDGKVALETVEAMSPDVLLLDVALPTMFGFEVCERVRQNPALSGVKIVLIASIYDKTRYKRSPNSLYGADDYIEKHHIPDALVPMIYRLASGGGPSEHAPTAMDLAAQDETRAEIREVEVAETSIPAAPPAAVPVADPFQVPLQEMVPLEEEALPEWGAPEPQASPSFEEPTDGPEMIPFEELMPLEELSVPAEPVAPPPVELSEPEKKARRLARIIVSDIVLYNQAKVEQGVREGNFYELLGDDIREGERLYRQRISEEIRENSNFLKDAFEDLIAKKRAELRM
jgi:predicted Zn finger-like uncharacterized protein